MSLRRFYHCSSLAFAILGYAVKKSIEFTIYLVRTMVEIFAPEVPRPLLTMPRLIAFQIIEFLKPVYQHSLETFGLSLRRRRSA